MTEQTERKIRPVTVRQLRATIRRLNARRAAFPDRKQRAALALRAKTAEDEIALIRAEEHFRLLTEEIGQVERRLSAMEGA